jgi:glycerate 2-kinase
MDNHDSSDIPEWAASYRRCALHLFQVGVGAADPYRAVRNALRMRGSRLEITRDAGGWSSSVRSEPWSRIYLVAFGKAACAMACAARDVMPAGLIAGCGIAVTNYENQIDVERFDVIGAGHPVPDACGYEGARAIAAYVSQAGADDLVLVLVSGGGSALVPYPVETISLEDKIATTERLLACGADITRINCVRKHLSRIKGGGLARLAAPADVHALILSDVLGDDLSSIASGPTVPDPTTFADALHVLEAAAVWGQVPASVREHLAAGCAGEREETPKPGDPIFRHVENTLVGSNRFSVDAVMRAAAAEGFETDLYDDALCGEAREEAAKLVSRVEQEMRNRKSDRPAAALVAGGETTVTLKGGGKGGRNQEMALAFALAAKRQQLARRWVFLSAGTDGRDGPTDAAGGLVDPWTLERMVQGGIDPENCLADNDSYSALQKSNDLVQTGATGTNVADLQVVLIHPERP